MRGPHPFRVSLLVSSCAVLGACGGGARPEIPTVALSKDGGATAPAPPAGTGLEGARLPPPLELGSKHASRKARPEWAACRATTKPAAAPAEVARVADALGTACAPGMKGAGAFAGDQSATSGAQAFPFKAEQGRCYRVVAAAAPGVRQLVVAIVDAEGQTAAEYAEGDGGKEGAGPLLAPAETVCFARAVEAKLTVSVGWGTGPFAVRVLSQ